MKVNELRVGSLVTTYFSDVRIFEVSAIHSDRIYLKSIVDTSQSDITPVYIKPVPLTEEWFLRFGFKKACFGYEKGLFEVANKSIDNYILSVACNEYTIGEPFIYVHQLQNLYFALTGEELTIKE